MMLFEVDQAANRVRAEVDPDANIIFGGTILENMEGRLRVSVVATGIEAEGAVRMPQNVEPLRPRMKAPPLPPRTETRAASVNHVRTQMESIAQEMNAQAATPLSPVEEMILGEAEAPVIEDELPPIPASIRPAQPMRPAVQNAPQPEPEEAPRRGGIGRFFGRGEKKPEPQRVEPAPAPRPTAAPRATAQVMTRGTQEPPRTAQTPQNVADDLFPDHKKDDQFEIPAFLRRQTN
jgi:cell division protein FtsZ